MYVFRLQLVNTLKLTAHLNDYVICSRLISKPIGLIDFTCQVLVCILHLSKTGTLFHNYVFILF